MAGDRARQRLEGLCKQERDLRKTADRRRETLVTGAAAAPEAQDGGKHRAGPLQLLERALAAVNGWVLVLGMVALVVASCILTYSVFSRYFLNAATDWQDETAVFFIIGAVFMSGAYVQSRRGHIGISALASLLPPGADRIR